MKSSGRSPIGLLSPQHKFAAIGVTIQGRTCEEDWTVATGMRVVPALAFAADDWWKTAFGEFHFEEAQGCSFFLVVESPSSTLELLDGENARLAQQVALWLSALCLTLPDQTLRTGIQFSGAHLGDRVDIRSVSLPYQPVPPQHAGFRRYTGSEGPDACPAVGITQLASAARLSRSLAFDPSLREREWRLRRALSIYFQARSEAMDFDKLYQFVRSLEAVAHLPPGKGAGDFARRASLFTGGEHEPCLCRMYRTRSLVQHVNEDRLLIPFDRTRMMETVHQLIGAEWLARHVLARILSTPTLRRCFGNAAAAEEFWELTSNRRRKLWGSPIDLGAAFGFYDLDLMSDQQLGKL